MDAYLIYLEPWCRNAYMDTALNSRAFVTSALHVSRVNQEFMDTATGRVFLQDLADMI